MSFNESTAYQKFYFQVSWGVTKTIFLEKFSFGDEFYYAEPLRIDGSVGPFVRNPVFIYPVTFGIDSNPAALALNHFFESGSLFPECSIWVKVGTGREVQDIIQYRFKVVKVLQKYGRDGDHRYSYYKLRYDDWNR
jgi:hypothetical protein